MSSPERSSHGQILKSSALIGGSSAVNMIVGMIRVKFTAVYLGTLGVGLFGAYNTILGPLGILAGMGINSSGVRQIADAAAKDDQQALARALITVRRASWITGLLGMLLMIALAYPLSMATFGNSSQTIPLCILSVTLLTTSVSGGLGAVIQGLRRIRDLASQAIIGSILSLPIAIPLMMMWGVKALVPMMLISTTTACFITWWFARRVPVAPVAMTWRDSWVEAKPLLQLGLVFMGTGLMGAATGYLQRVLVIRQLGLEANGIYSAAFNLSNYYIGFILGAMGADFYPRLTAVNRNHSEVNRLVNEQIEVGLLMAFPGVVATLALAPLVIWLFYTREFMPAVDVLRWQTLGLVLRLISWPMAYILLAKGEKRWYLWAEFIANAASLIFVWGCIRLYGLIGTGVAFFLLYVFHVGLMVLIAKRLTGFAWSRETKKLIGWMIVVLTITLLAAWNLPLIHGAIVGVVIASIMAWLSLRTLTRLTGKNPVIAVWKKLIGMLPVKSATPKKATEAVE